MIVSCTGMPRSGSTWSFRVCRLLLQHRAASEPTCLELGHRSADLEEFLQADDDPATDVLVKVHELGPVARTLIQDGRIRNVYTWRDPRDVVASAHRLWSRSIEEVLAPGRIERYVALASELVRGGKTLFISYETIRTDHQNGIAQIASHLGCPCDDALRRTIAADTSFDEHKRVLSDLDPVTRQPRLHIQDGRSGYWRQYLTPRQAAEVLERVGPELVRLWGLDGLRP